MTTAVKPCFLQILILACVLPVAAQTQNVVIRADAEYRVAGRDAQQTGMKLALAEARRKVLRDSVTQLQSTIELKAIPLRPGQLEALIPAVLEVETESTRSERITDTTLHKATVRVQLKPREIALRIDKLRLDPNAVRGLMEVWKQAEALHQQLALPAGGNARSATEQDSLARRLLANQLVTAVYAGLGRTEESPASSRVASAKGRQRALQLAETAIMAEPDSQETHLAMGDALISYRHDDAAEAEYRQALLLSPESSRAHIKLAEALRVKEKLPEAIVELREAFRLDPNSAMAHDDLGFILGAQQKQAEAISEYREALRIDPDYVDAHNNLGITLARQGKMPDAAVEFREILRIDPTSVLGYYNLAIALADMDKDEESAEALRQAVHFNPNHFNAHFNLGELFRLESKFDEAVKQFREYLRLAPDTPQNQRNIGRATDFVKTHENQ